VSVNSQPPQRVMFAEEATVLTMDNAEAASAVSEPSTPVRLVSISPSSSSAAPMLTENDAVVLRGR